MQSAALAIGWQFQRRHRWGLAAVAIYFAMLAAVRVLMVRHSFALVVVVPLTTMFIYCLAVFSFGLDGDLVSRESIFPARLFTLPVTNAALAGWPIAYGAATIVVLWLAVRTFAVWPYDVTLPVIWPALMAASLLAWTQALTWLPYPLRGLRVVVAVLWLASIDAMVLIALFFHAREPLMLAILAPHVPLAFVVARYGVSRARCGDVPELHRGNMRAHSRHQRPFASARAAQVWLEWRQHGRALPLLVAILLPAELSLLFLFHETPAIVAEIVIAVLLTPPFMAAFVAPSARAIAVTTRPLSDEALVNAKFAAALRSTLVAWLLVAVATPIALGLSGTASMVADFAHRLAEIVGTPRAVAITLLTCAALMASTWKQLVQSISIGMSGRAWLARANMFLMLSLLVAIGFLRHVAWNALPWLLAVLVWIKVAIATWIATRRPRVFAACVWALLVFGLYALLTWIVPEIIVRHYALALIAILEVPLVRLSAAPLALAWNRHR